MLKLTFGTNVKLIIVEAKLCVLCFGYPSSYLGSFLNFAEKSSHTDYSVSLSLKPRDGICCLTLKAENLTIISLISLVFWGFNIPSL